VVSSERFAKALKINRKDGGFTLVEVLTAIAILSIVSVALLQTFVTSAKINRIANVMDEANALCIETAEEFRADPQPSSDYLSGFNTTDIPGSYVLYYNGEFDRDTASSTKIDGVSEYEVVITPKEIPGTRQEISDCYYPDPAAEESITGGSNTMNLVYDAVTGVKLNTTSIPLDKVVFSSVGKTAMIPIKVDCSGLTADADIEFTNSIGKLRDPDTSEEMTAIADLYICNKPSGRNVEVTAVDGPVTSNEINENTVTMVQYEATVKVIRLSDSEVIARYEVDKYWIGES